MPNIWTDAEIKFLHENVKTKTYTEIAIALKRRTEYAVRTRANKLGYVTRFYWKPKDVQILRRDYPANTAVEIADKLCCSVYCVYNKAWSLGLKKDKAFMSELLSRAMKNPNHGARRSQFKNGDVPHNKGKKCGTRGRMGETQFKTGNVPPNQVAVGTIVNHDGYQKIKIAMPNKWQYVHRHLWEMQHGAIPKSHALVFKDGDRNNLTLENFEMITRRELRRRNYEKFNERYPVELKTTIRLCNKLDKKIKKEKESNAAK